MNAPIVVLLFAAGCTDPSVSLDGPVASDVEQVGSAPGSEEGPSYDADFFDDTFVHLIDITLSADAQTDLRRDPYEFVSGDVTIDGWAFPDVGVRLRGKIGSFRDLSGKPKFKIDFNTFGAEARLGPFKALALNNEVVDCSYLREPVGYALFRQLGVPAPRTTYTQVTVNGEAYGLYVAVEFPDDTFLESRYADGSGNLYDGKYLYWGAESYALVDFTPEYVGNFTLEEGEEVNNADVNAIAAAVRAEGTFAERLGPLLDTDAFHRFLVAEQWTGQLDGYGLNSNNYRVYFDPADGKAELLPYDLDYAFYPSGSWGIGWSAPVGVLAQACWADEACYAEHHAAVTAAVAVIDTPALLADVDRWTALITQPAEDDPRRECRRRQIAPEMAAMRAWVETGTSTLEGAW
jgi:spore coat protein CotH